MSVRLMRSQTTVHRTPAGFELVCRTCDWRSATTEATSIGAYREARRLHPACTLEQQGRLL